MPPEQPKVLAEFKQCPNPVHKEDGLGKRFAFDEIAKEQIAKGKIGEGLQFGFPMSGVVTDIRKTSLTAPMVVVVADVCLDCGMIFGKTILTQESQLNAPVMRPGPQNPGGRLFPGR